MLFKEYIGKISRKSGPSRKFTYKSLLGNPNLMIPSTGNKNKDTQRRYKGKFYKTKLNDFYEDL
jgi:hypothetical protein